MNSSFPLLAIIEVATFVWLVLWASLAVYELSRGNARAQWPIILVFFLFMGLPLAMDHVVGLPSYRVFPGFARSSRDADARLLYSAYVALAPVIISLVAYRPKSFFAQVPSLRESIDRATLAVARYRPVLLVVALFPVAAASISPFRSVYLIYGNAYPRVMSLASFAEQEAFLRFHVLINMTGMLSIAAVGMLILTARGKLWMPTVFVYLPILIADVWLNGKRNAFALALLVFTLSLWGRGALRSWRLYAAGTLLLGGLLLYSDWYQDTVRGHQDYSFQRTYDNFRIDFGRDHTLRLAIYALVNPEQDRILDHVGDSLVSYAAIVVPESLWAEKPLSYGHQVTSSALMRDDPQRTWTVTTSILDESVSNFGWFGFFLGPAILGAISRVADSRGFGAVWILSVLTGSLLQALHLKAFFPIFSVWLIVSVFYWLKPATRGSVSVPRRRPQNLALTDGVGKG